MLSILDCQRNRLKYMIHARIAEDVDGEYPANINRVRREEAVGADIEYLYGKTFVKLYRMMLEIYGVINASSDPFNDPAVDSVLEKYEYYISPTGRHIYGTGPRF